MLTQWLEQCIDAGGSESELEEVQGEERQRTSPGEPQGHDDEELILHTGTDATFSEEPILSSGLNPAAAPFIPNESSRKEAEPCGSMQLERPPVTQAAYRTLLFMVNCVQADQRRRLELGTGDFTAASEAPTGSKRDFGEALRVLPAESAEAADSTLDPPTPPKVENHGSFFTHF